MGMLVVLFLVAYAAVYGLPTVLPAHDTSPCARFNISVQRAPIASAGHEPDWVTTIQARTACWNADGGSGLVMPGLEGLSWTPEFKYRIHVISVK